MRIANAVRAGLMVGAVALSGVAGAATLMPSFILSQTLKAHEGLKTLALEGRITDVRTNLVFKEILKVDFASGKVDAVFLGANDEPYGGIASSIKDLHRLGKFWITVALDGNVNRFHQAIAELNMTPTDKAEAKLDRVSGQVTLAWGEDGEIQFLKDEFVPTDYRTGGPSPQEIFLKDYANSAVRVPRNVLVKLESKDAYRYELKAMKVNQPLKQPSAFAEPSQTSVKEWTMLVR